MDLGSVPLWMAVTSSIAAAGAAGMIAWIVVGLVRETLANAAAVAIRRGARARRPGAAWVPQVPAGTIADALPRRSDR